MLKKLPLLLLIAISLTSIAAFAATNKVEGVRVIGRFIPGTAHIGDDISFLVMIDAPEAYKIQKPESASGDWGDFELKSETLLRESHANSAKRLIYKYTLTIFDIGEFKIPPLLVKYADARGVVDAAMLSAMSVKVTPLPQGPKEKDDIRPIKGPISVDLEVWRIILTGAVALALFIWLCVRLWKHWHKKKTDDESLKPPHVRLELELGRLQEQYLMGQGKVKEHFAELSDILRRYIERRFKIEALELTTRELLLRLKENEQISSQYRERIREILETADLVKFAKSESSRAAADAFAATIVQFAQDTKPPEVKK